MRFNVDNNYQSAVLTTVYTYFALIVISDCLTIINTRRDSYRNYSFLFDSTFPSASFTFIGHNLTRSAASRTFCPNSLSTKNSILRNSNCTATMTIRTSSYLGRVTCTATFAVRAFFGTINFYRFFGTFYRFLKSNVYTHGYVIAVYRHICTVCPTSTTEKLTENIFKSTETAKTTTAAATKAAVKLRAVFRTELVVVSFLLRVGKHIVSVVDFLKSLLRLLALCLRFSRIPIRMIFHYSFSICCFNLLLACIFLYAKQIVIIFICHKISVLF